MTSGGAAAGLTVGQVSRLLGVPVPTLRSWQARYGIPTPARTLGGHRRYTSADVALLQAFRTAVSRGVAPRTAAQTLRQPWPDVEVPLSHLTSLLDHAVACDPEGVCAALDEAQAAMGLDQAVDRVLVPGLRELGRRWEVGEVDVGVEHLTTVAVRRWIAGRPRTRPEGDVPPVVLAGAPGNRHTVALEAFDLLLRRRGQPTRMLGADTPVPALLRVLRRTGAVGAVVTAQQVSRRRQAVLALQAVSAEPGVQAFYAGAAFDAPARRRGVPGRYLGTDLPAAADLVAEELSGEA